jgi:hypothetical protein
MDVNTYDKSVVQTGVWRVPTATLGPVATHHTPALAPRYLVPSVPLVPQSWQARVHQLKLQLAAAGDPAHSHLCTIRCPHPKPCVSVFQDHPLMMLCSR